MYNDGFDINRQKEQLNMPTISDETFRKEYLEALSFCVETDEIFQKFYEDNQRYYNYINHLGSDVNGMVKRVIPIIPKKKKK